MNHLIWFREDLRVTDNTALYYACKQANAGVVAVYFITPSIWKNHDMAACRVDFLLRGLKTLSKDLQDLNIALQVVTIDEKTDISQYLVTFCQQYQVSKIYFNRQYEVNELKRDLQVKNLCEREKIAVHLFHDQCILPPESIKTATGNFYTVFTPFKKMWLLTQSQLGPNSLLPKPDAMKKMDLNPSIIPDVLSDFHSQIDPDLWPAGEHAARERLQFFIDKGIAQYHINRDFPAIDGTSKLSPYLSAGMISSRECFLVAREKSHDLQDPLGAETWISELIWREFYRHVLVGFPRVCKHKPFKLHLEHLAWNHDENLLRAWQLGCTGYPLVDAAMRQLNTTGWMHNRLRMLVAMVLSKLMLLDWRLGESYFMQHLIDGDLASNNGGWQWSASTGTDAVPYFRIFNPYSQSKKFDPQGTFIRQFCPELASLDDDAIHQPELHLHHNKLNYPKPVFDYAKARLQALAAFKQKESA